VSAPTDYRVDGNFYIRHRCHRCGELFYHFALRNMSMNEVVLEGCGIMYCDWCAGKCSAAEQSYATQYISERGERD
jgi:hypothetical protein